jgi:hypothetical protein
MVVSRWLFCEYICEMRELLASPVKMLGIAVATSGALLLAIFTFQGWIRHGTDIFLSSVQSGIAWCF